MRSFIVGILVLLVASALRPAFGEDSPLDALRAELLSRESALTGDLAASQRREKKAYKKALKLLDRDTPPFLTESEIALRVVRTLKRVTAADAGLTAICKAGLDRYSDGAAGFEAYCQALIDMGEDGPEKEKAQNKLDRATKILDAAGPTLTKQARGILKSQKKFKSVLRLAKRIPAPDGSRLLGRRALERLGIDTSLGGFSPEVFLGRWWVENVTTGERMGILLCNSGAIEVDVSRRYGTGRWYTMGRELYAFIPVPGGISRSFAGIESPMYGSVDTKFWTRGVDADSQLHWYIWTRRTHDPVITLAHDIQGVDVSYGEGSSDQTVSLDFRIDWSVENPRFVNGKCGYMALAFEFYADSGSGYEWTWADYVQGAEYYPLTTAEGRYEGRAVFTGGSLWLERPKRMRLVILYSLADSCDTAPETTKSVHLTITQ